MKKCVKETSIKVNFEAKFLGYVVYTKELDRLKRENLNCGLAEIVQIKRRDTGDMLSSIKEVENTEEYVVELATEQGQQSEIRNGYSLKYDFYTVATTNCVADALSRTFHKVVKNEYGGKEVKEADIGYSLYKAYEIHETKSFVVEIDEGNTTHFTLSEFYERFIVLDNSIERNVVFESMNPC